MGGSSKTQSNQTQTNTIDPQQLAMLKGNYAGAQDRAASLTPYTGQLTAGFNPTQLQAQGVLSGIATDPFYGQAYDKAMSANQGILGNPANPTITPQTLSGTDLSAYMNPFQKDVIDATMAQINQQRGQQQVADNASATAAGAFGGDRQAVQRALTSQLYDQDTASTLANLNAANFNQAQAGATGDITRNLQAQQDTFGNRLAGDQFQLGAANNLANLSNSKLANATQQAGILGAVGDIQQQQKQQELTNAYNAYLQGQQLTVEQQQLLNSALGLVPIQQTVTGSGTSQTKTNPGIGGILGSLGQIGMSAAMLAG